MKRILITGINSYVGRSFMDYMKSRPGYKCIAISMRDGSWRNEDFSHFDTVFGCTPSLSAICFWVIPFDLRRSRSSFPF